MSGDKAAARESYQDFFTLWKDADPNIPIYKQAKAEHAKLRRAVEPFPQRLSILWRARRAAVVTCKRDRCTCRHSARCDITGDEERVVVSLLGRAQGVKGSCQYQVVRCQSGNSRRGKKADVSPYKGVFCDKSL